MAWSLLVIFGTTATSLVYTIQNKAITSFTRCALFSFADVLVACRSKFRIANGIDFASHGTDALTPVLVLHGLTESCSNILSNSV